MIFLLNFYYSFVSIDNDDNNELKNKLEITLI